MIGSRHNDNKEIVYSSAAVILSFFVCLLAFSIIVTDICSFLIVYFHIVTVKVLCFAVVVIATT